MQGFFYLGGASRKGFATARNGFKVVFFGKWLGGQVRDFSACFGYFTKWERNSPERKQARTWELFWSAGAELVVWIDSARKSRWRRARVKTPNVFRFCCVKKTFLGLNYLVRNQRSAMSSNLSNGWDVEELVVLDESSNLLLITRFVYKIVHYRTLSVLQCTIRRALHLKWNFCFLPL